MNYEQIKQAAYVDELEKIAMKPSTLKSVANKGFIESGILDRIIAAKKHQSFVNSMNSINFKQGLGNTVIDFSASNEMHNLGKHYPEIILKYKNKSPESLEALSKLKNRKAYNVSIGNSFRTNQKLAPKERIKFFEDYDKQYPSAKIDRVALRKIVENG